MSLLDLASVRAERQAATAQPRKRLRYEEMISFIENLVADGNLAPGDLLPTQAELADMAGVSLITVRRALEELERAGRVRRHQGVGTFLAKPRIISEPGRSGGLLSTLRQSEEEPPRIGTRLLKLVRGAPSPALRDALRLGPDDLVWQIMRQRLVDGEPKILETAVIPVALAPTLDLHKEALTGSLYQLLADRYGLEDHAEEQYLEVSAADADERRLLRLPARSQVVRLRGLSVDANDVPFDCFVQVYPALEFGFYISGATSRELLRGPVTEGWDVTPEPVAQHRAGERPRARRPGTPAGGA
ncbi:MAG TPA: GntR family transcriptional regulator [Trebonia sp.]|nr:GntR family transcriptional regulator [Trebonia sp.]